VAFISWIDEQSEQSFKPATEGGWIAVLPTCESVNLYLNETLLFEGRETLSFKGKRVLHLLDKLFQALPLGSRIYLEGPNGPAPKSSSHLTAEMGLQVSIMINGRPFPLEEVSSPRLESETQIHRLRVVLVSS